MGEGLPQLIEGVQPWHNQIVSKHKGERTHQDTDMRSDVLSANARWICSGPAASAAAVGKSNTNIVVDWS
jgi:hypothetical protein